MDQNRILSLLAQGKLADIKLIMEQHGATLTNLNKLLMADEEADGTWDDNYLLGRATWIKYGQTYKQQVGKVVTSSRPFDLLIYFQ